MISKILEKNKAIDLRKSGKTYSDILKIVPVAKSTLSLWLREIGLSKKQKQNISKKKLESALRGGLIRKKQRIEISKEIFSKSEKEIGKLSHRELWMIGTALYWAEGSKEKDYRPGSGVDFTNSDPKMIKFFVFWLKKILKIPSNRIRFEIYIHENYKEDLERVKNFWSNVLDFSKNNSLKVYYKRHSIKTNRKNIGNVYNGILRIRVSESSSYLRQITGWTIGICKIK